MNKDRFHPLHERWRSMIRRCTEEKNKDYSYYGARGIKVCKRWLCFENFVKDMGIPSDLKMQIDRKNNNKGYSKSNCRWVTSSVNNTNRRIIKKDGLPKGVRKYPNHKKFCSSMFIAGVYVHLGSFDTTEEARKEYELHYFEWYGFYPN